MKIGIVGAECAKFTHLMEQQTRQLIRKIIKDAIAKTPFPRGVYDQPRVTVVSGGCHLGGVDIWAVEEGRALGCGIIEHLPKKRFWTNGFRERNEKIAQDSDGLHVIVVDGYHDRYEGERFPSCYHCHTRSHVKSGACWTGKLAKKLGVPVRWHLIASRPLQYDTLAVEPVEFPPQ
jgi:hypothetical protein